MEVAEKLWPLELAEEWDAVGLVCGDITANVSTIMFCVDPTHEVIDEALELGAQLIIAHHPLYLKGTHHVAKTHHKGSIVHRLIKHDIALYTAHTNADSAFEGVSEQLAFACGLEDFSAIAPQASNPQLGLGRIGSLEVATTLNQLAHTLSEALPITAGGIRIAGDLEKKIEKVAVCGGAGDSLIDEVIAQGADVYITSDLRHHPVLEAQQNSDVAFIDTAHFASESLWLAAAAEQFEEQGYVVHISNSNSDPWDALVIQSEE